MTNPGEENPWRTRLARSRARKTAADAERDAQARDEQQLRAVIEEAIGPPPSPPENPTPAQQSLYVARLAARDLEARSLEYRLQAEAMGPVDLGLGFGVSAPLPKYATDPTELSVQTEAEAVEAPSSNSAARRGRLWGEGKELKQQVAAIVRDLRAPPNPLPATQKNIAKKMGRSARTLRSWVVDDLDYPDFESFMQEVESDYLR